MVCKGFVNPSDAFKKDVATDSKSIANAKNLPRFSQRLSLFPILYELQTFH